MRPGGMNPIRRRVALGLLTVVISSGGCGGGDGPNEPDLSPAAQARAQVASSTTRAEELRAQLDEITRSTDAAYETYFAFLKRASEALSTSGDLAGANELRTQAQEVMRDARPELQRAARLRKEIGNALADQSRAQRKLDALVGCNRACRSERNRMSKLGAKCLLDATRSSGSLSRREFRSCRNRFPVTNSSGE